MKKDMATKYVSKTEVLNKAFALSFNGNQSFHHSPTPEPLGGLGENKIPPTIRKVQAQNHLMRLNMFVGPNDTHPRILKEQADVVAKPFFTIIKKSWLSGEAPQ